MQDKRCSFKKQSSTCHVFIPLCGLLVAMLPRAPTCTHVHTHLQMASRTLGKVWSGGRAALSSPPSSLPSSGPGFRVDRRISAGVRIGGSCPGCWVCGQSRLTSEQDPPLKGLHWFLVINERGRLGSGLGNGSLGFWETMAEFKGTGLWQLINTPGGVSAWEGGGGTRRAPVPPLSKCHASEKTREGARVPSILEGLQV